MRLIGKLVATLLVLILLGATVFLTMMHTRFATPMTVRLFNTVSPYQLEAEQVVYDIEEPWRLSLNQLRLQPRAAETPSEPQTPFTANQLTLWLSPSSLLAGHWHFDTILLDGLNLSADSASLPVPAELSSQRLALSNLTWHSADITLSEGEIQLDNWHFRASDPRPFWQQFTGNFQIAARTLRWQQFPVEKLLLDGNYTAPALTLYGFSFDWQHAGVNGQLELDTRVKALQLHQLTVSDLQLQQGDELAALQTWLHHWTQAGGTATLGRLDMLDISLELPSLALNHASLSLENWHWPQSAYQQPEAWLSFSAESGSWQALTFTDPLLELAFTPAQVTIKGASVNALEGYGRAAGILTPESLQLDSLVLKGLKVFLPPHWQQTARTAFAHWPTIRIDSLDIGYSQLVDTAPASPWHLTGLNLKGQDLLLRRENQPGLWQGSLTAGAGAASFNTISLTGPYLAMESEQGQWQLSEATLPFADGLLNAKGTIDLNTAGRPWSLQWQGDSLPAALLAQWLQLPLPVKGKLDTQGQLKGLAANRLSLAHSLDGNLTASLREGTLSQPAAQLWQHWQQTGQPIVTEPTDVSAAPAQAITTTETATDKPAVATIATNTTPAKAPAASVTITPLAITSDRGRITVAPMSLHSGPLQAGLEGKWDMADPAAQQLEWQASYPCRQPDSENRSASTGSRQQLVQRWQGDQHTVLLSPCEGNNI